MTDMEKRAALLAWVRNVIAFDGTVAKIPGQTAVITIVDTGIGLNVNLALDPPCGRVPSYAATAAAIALHDVIGAIPAQFGEEVES